MESIKAALGLDIAHIPTRAPGSVPALLGNQVAAVFSAMPSIAGAVKENRLRLIAENSAERSPLAPNVPTIANPASWLRLRAHIGVSGPRT